ncbi:acyltransferase family protein [Dysgonomonas macrotermitis]|uniref:Peptidoglycan/LPS O-acetylase OafA/YrhL, contains acyltransferase and SGNH-hydrolase domains n=1 Tax=Dysgonomonas macrotermitis TaxID=1346286 RepID=A0A1M4YMT3_9BACT|nr:acyltransferase [Dysgonomonas macrotermitis]SHF07119.1 Peptidoglycan/LPS O-acetylase OafA/YrhL, contains acyltransferase and SGNH-hydrolase domains [Dysgonomonas macrotermitis]
MLKLGYIDALRGWAVIGVLLVHCLGYGNEIYPSILNDIAENGGRGVQLFFIVSAFTLFLSLSRRNDKNTNIYRGFFIRRFFRIAPMFYLAIIYFTIERYFWGVLTPDIPPELTSSSIISTFFFVHGFNPYWINTVVPGGWTISVEMVFYCLVPFLFMKIKNMNQASIFILITILLQHVITNLLKVYPFTDDPTLNQHFLYYYLPNQLPVFACGIFMFFLITVPKKEWSISPYVIVLFALGALLQITTGRELYSNHVIYGIAFVFLGYALSLKEIKLFVNPITRYLGKISFSMYLMHFVVLHWMAKWNLLNFVESSGSFLTSNLNFGIRFVILLFMSVLLSSISYRCIEKPFLELGRKIIRRIESTV